MPGQDVHRMGARAARAVPDHGPTAGAGRARGHRAGITPAEAARHAGLSWPTVHDAFAAAADPLLEQPIASVPHRGIDEHRRGRARFAADPQTGECILLADKWHTCFFDLSGQQGLRQVQGRTADNAAYGLAGPPRGDGTRSRSWRATCAPSTP